MRQWGSWHAQHRSRVPPLATSTSLSGNNLRAVLTNAFALDDVRYDGEPLLQKRTEEKTEDEEASYAFADSRMWSRSKCNLV